MLELPEDDSAEAVAGTVTSDDAPRRLGAALAALVVVIAGAVLVLGWGLGADAVRRIAPGYPAMVPATALTLLAGSLGALVLTSRRPDRLLAGLSALAIVAVLAAERIWGLTPAGLGTSDGMSVASALCAGLLGLGLASRALQLRTAAVAIDTIGLAVASVPLVGYVFGAETLYGNALYTLMALHTALCHVMLFFALSLSEPRRGWIAVLLSDEPGSGMARRLLPITVAAPLLLSSAAALAVDLDLVTDEFRLAALTFLIIAFTATAVVFFAHLTNLAERRGIAAEVRAERRLRETEIAAARAEKVAALGRLVGGVAHDFNNTLSVIIGNLELIRAEQGPEARKEYLANAIGASHRAADLTRQLLAYGRRSPLDPRALALDDEVGTVLSMFSRVCPAGVSVESSLAVGPRVVRLDATALQQAVLNVLINAGDALSNGTLSDNRLASGGRIMVRTRVETLDGAIVDGDHGFGDLPPGDYAVIRIEDDGTGMSPDVAARATEPFFTTKPVGHGTGLGLSTVAGFCRQSGGGLRIDSAAGAGTTVTLVFPVVGTPGDLDAGPDGPPASAHVTPTPG